MGKIYTILIAGTILGIAGFFIFGTRFGKTSKEAPLFACGFSALLGGVCGMNLVLRAMYDLYIYYIPLH